MIGLKVWMKPKPLWLNPNVHSKPPGRQQDRPAIKTATPSMGGARVRSITVDNGVEFSAYEDMERSAVREGEKRTYLFYCHPYSSWERGTNENTNRLIRRHIPKGEDFDEK